MFAYGIIEARRIGEVGKGSVYRVPVNGVVVVVIVPENLTEEQRKMLAFLVGEQPKSEAS